jgi:hypothetical protein
MSLIPTKLTAKFSEIPPEEVSTFTRLAEILPSDDFLYEKVGLAQPALPGASIIAPLFHVQPCVRDDFLTILPKIVNRPNIEPENRIRLRPDPDSEAGTNDNDEKMRTEAILVHVIEELHEICENTDHWYIATDFLFHKLANHIKLCVGAGTTVVSIEAMTLQEVILDLFRAFVVHSEANVSHIPRSATGIAIEIFLRQLHTQSSLGTMDHPPPQLAVFYFDNQDTQKPSHFLELFRTHYEFLTSGFHAKLMPGSTKYLGCHIVTRAVEVDGRFVQLVTHVIGLYGRHFAAVPGGEWGRRGLENVELCILRSRIWESAYKKWDPPMIRDDSEESEA